MQLKKKKKKIIRRIERGERKQNESHSLWTEANRTPSEASQTLDHKSLRIRLEAPREMNLMRPIETCKSHLFEPATVTPHDNDTGEIT